MLLVKGLSSAKSASDAVMHRKKGVEAFHLSLPREWWKQAEDVLAIPPNLIVIDGGSGNHYDSSV